MKTISQDQFMRQDYPPTSEDATRGKYFFFKNAVRAHRLKINELS